ncbi:spindle pole body protein pcp1-like isoform X2 [Centruroides sculpturatus]|uniref:spindle pole body protein pcp1-like isoform X2 n=1 Tax=Centruroides sculpturatus TaxID=218467 RepID=UPI000C6E8A10|nr:spindle pole body protein pcp1-like isoform X2 [Centruroides sculpturatus]
MTEKMSVNSDSNGLNHLISQLVGKIGEEEVAKLLNVASNCLEDGGLIISQAKAISEISDNEILYVNNAKSKSKGKKGSNTESDYDSDTQKEFEDKNRSCSKSHCQKNSKSRSDKTVSSKKQKLSSEESSVKRKKISSDKIQNKVCSRKSISELDNSCSSENASSSNTCESDSKIQEDSTDQSVNLSRNDSGTSDKASTNNKTIKRTKLYTDKKSLKCQKNAPQEGINESEKSNSKDSKVNSTTKQNSQRNDLNKNLEKTDKSNHTKSQQRTDCNIQTDANTSNVDDSNKQQEEHPNTECNKSNPRKKLRRDSFTSQFRVLRSHLVSSCSSEDKSNSPLKENFDNIVCNLDKSSKYDDKLINQQDFANDLGDAKGKNDKNLEVTTTKKQKIVENKEESFQDQSKPDPNKQSNSKRNLKRKQSSVQIQKDLSKSSEQTSTGDKTSDEVRSKIGGQIRDESPRVQTSENKQSPASKKRAVLDSLKKDLNEEEEKRKITEQTARDSADCDVKNVARQTSATSKTEKEETRGNKRARSGEYDGKEMEEVNTKSKQNSISDFTSLIKSCYVNLKREDLEKKMTEGKNVTSKRDDKPNEDDLNRDGKDQKISSKLNESEKIFKSSSLGEKKDQLWDKRETKENKQVQRKDEKLRDVNESIKIKRTFTLKNDNAKKVECSSKEQNTRAQQSQKPKSSKRENTPTDAKILNNENSLEAVDFKDEEKTSETDFAEKQTKEVQSKILANKTKLTRKKSLVGQDVTPKRQLIEDEDESVNNENRSVNKDKLTEHISQKVVVKAKNIKDKNENIISIADRSKSPCSKDKNRSLNVKDQNKTSNNKDQNKGQTDKDKCTDKISSDESSEKQSNKNQRKDVDSTDKSINKDQVLKKQTQNISCGKDRTENNKKSVDKEDLVKEVAREETAKKQLSQTENKARKLRRLQINTQIIKNNEKTKVKSTIKPPSPVKKGSGSRDNKEKISAKKEVNVRQEQLEDKLKIKSSATENKEPESPNIVKIQNINRNDYFSRETEHSSTNKSKCTKTTTNVLNLKRKTEDSSNASANKIDPGKVSSKTSTNSSNSAITIKKDTKISVKLHKKDELSLKSNENIKKECVESLNDAKLSNQRSKVCEAKKQSTETKINDTPTVGGNVTVESHRLQIRKLKRNNIVRQRILKSETVPKSLDSLAGNSGKGGSLSASHWPDDDKKDDVAKTKKGVNDDNLSKDKNIEKEVKETTSDTVSKKEKEQNRKLYGEEVFTIKDDIRITKNISDPSNRRISVVKNTESRTLKRSGDQREKASADTLQNSKGNESRNDSVAVKKIKTADKLESVEKGDDKVSKSITLTDDTIKSIATKVLKNISKIKSDERNDTEAKPTEKLQKTSNVKRKTEENSDKSCDFIENNSNSAKNRVEKCVKKPFKIEEDNGVSRLEIWKTETEEASHNTRMDDLIINNAAKENENGELLPLILDVRQVSSSEWELSDSLDAAKISENISLQANESHRQIYASSESLDKYADLKQQFNEAGISLEEAVKFIDVEKLKSAIESGEDDTCVLLGRTHCCQFNGQIVKPSLVVIKSYKKFTEAKDAVWCRRYGVKRCRVVLNGLRFDS